MSKENGEHNQSITKIDPDYLRNLIFGVEDSLVSTVGVLFGLASSNEYTSHQIILAGLVLTSVEALSMGVGSYISESEIHELDHEKRHKDNAALGGLIMFISYFLGGIFTLSPYLFATPQIGKYLSFILAIIVLFLIGFLPAKKSKVGLKTALLAGGAIIVGYLVAIIFKQ